MNNSWYLGRLANIDIRVHWTFLLLPVWIYFSSLASGSGAVVAVTSVLFVLAIFGCVVLHELGHALTARKFGVATRDITLLPIGGVASLERMPRKPEQELAIAVAGPAVNVVIAIVLAILLVLLGGALPGGIFRFLARLALVNVGLVVFNMIPAFPMDGGRVLRSVLAMFLPYARATELAAHVGQVVAVALGLLGLVSGNVMLVFVALFVFFAAKGEVWHVHQAFPQSGRSPTLDAQRRSSSVTDGRPLVIRDPFPVVLAAGLTVDQAITQIANQPGEDFPVEDGNATIGAISRSDLIRAKFSGGGRIPIRHLLSMRYLQPTPQPQAFSF